ncbi:hypothetical protein C3F00_044480, partial [Pseudomonas sp. MWU13-2860]
MHTSKQGRRDIPLAVVSLLIVFALVFVMIAMPNQSVAVANQLMYWCTTVFASPILLFAFFAVLFVIWLG